MIDREEKEMREQEAILYKGLNKLYQSELIAVGCLLCSVLILVPYLGLLIAVCMLIATVVELVYQVQGLMALKKLDQRYMTVLVLYVICIICGLVKNVKGLEVVKTVLSLAAVWIEIKTTNGYLEQAGRSEVADKGNTVLKMSICLAVISVLVTAAALSGVGGRFLIGMTLFGIGLFSLLSMVLSVIRLVLHLNYLEAARNVFAS